MNIEWLNSKEKYDSEPLTEVDIFKMKNKLNDVEFQFLHLLKRLGRRTLGEITFPNGEVKNIVK